MTEQSASTEAAEQVAAASVNADAAKAIEDDPIVVRRMKREALLAAGKNPYGARFDYTHHTAELEEKYAELADGDSTEDVVKVAGRVMAIRDQGKIVFMVIRDESGDLQLFCRINVLG